MQNDFVQEVITDIRKWARLIGGAGVQVGKTSNNPQQRLTRFKRLYEQIRETYDKTPLLQSDSSASDSIRTCFQRLTTILHDESRAPAPHLCLQYASTAQIYTTVSRIGAVAQHEGIIREAIALFAALIDSEEEDFLANDRFARSLMIFVDRTCGSGNLFVGEDTEADIVELLFGIAAKIRLQPEILPVWFTTSARTDARRIMRKKDDFVGVTSKEDFPLCYQLIDHVHHDGRIGDFSRTGLLYIFESASKSKALEQWIVESDLPTLMASGLGALYGRLSRKLSILHPKSELPIILTLSDYSDLQAPAGAESLYSQALQQDLETFLSYLLFWQDILEHCRSVDVKQTLLDHFQVLFLQQLLYPSILESSDVDGGSSVAVLTYLRQILDALEATEMVDLLLQYLFGISEDSSQDQNSQPRSPLALKRRLSLMLLTQPVNEDDRFNPSLFSLIDLLLNSTTSINPQTVISALRLITVVLSKDHKYCINTLLQVTPATDSSPRRTHGALSAEIEAYLTLAEEIGGEAGIDETYDSQLKDALRLIESHVCSNKALSLKSLGIASEHIPEFDIKSSVPEVISHYLRRDDVLFQHAMFTLETFLTNNVELNLSLTESIIALASCPHLRLEGWAVVEPRYYHFLEILAQDAGDDTSDPLRKLRQARRQPTWSDKHAPLIFHQLQSLRAEVRQLASMVPNFDRLVATRKQAFHLHDDISEAMQSTATPKLASGTQPSANWTPQKPQSLPQRMLSGATTPIRSSSPRGRTGTSDLRSPVMSPSRSTNPTGTASPSPLRRERPISGEMQKRAPKSQNLLSDVIEAANSEALTRKITFPLDQTAGNINNKVEPGDAENSTDGANSSHDEMNGSEYTPGTGREASLSHILTNVVILQEFILEFVAILQVRASMFGEVLFA